jgi:hypothetical protein
MAMTYSPEAIQEFKRKDLRIHKSGIVKSYIESKGIVPTREFMDEAINRIYEMTEKDKQHINPDYVPNTEDGAPFDGGEFNRSKKNLKKDLSDV